MTGIRRLEATRKDDPFERGRASPVRCFDVERKEVHSLLRERRELVVASETGLMLLSPKGSRAWLCYGFDSIDALRREFRSMLDSLAGSLKADEAKTGIFLWYTDQPNRPYIEPVLSECFFALQYEWMEMDLAVMPEEPAPSDEVEPGFILRPVAASEYESIAIIDVAAFADDTWQAADFVEAAKRASEMRMLEERNSGRIAGYVGLVAEGGTGKVAFLAVHPDFQRRGLGEAMLRWSLAWLRQQSMRRAKLIVRADNASAIALYRKLGFVPGRRGLVYRRPTSKQELDAIAAKRKGTYIKFGGWR
jgi:[ribosomal protein S18]-alanine N-acetyltransferase